MSFVDTYVKRRTANNVFFTQVNQIINWAPIEKELKKICRRGKKERGCKAYNPLILFKMQLISVWYNLSDIQTENMVNENLSAMCFCRLSLEDSVPECIIYLQRNLLAKVRSAHKQEIADDFKKVLNPDGQHTLKEIAMKELKIFTKKWDKYYKYIGKLPDKEDISYYFIYLDFHHKIRRMIYTTNWIERFNKSCRRTLKIRNSFPSPTCSINAYYQCCSRKRREKVCISNS